MKEKIHDFVITLTQDFIENNTTYQPDMVIMVIRGYYNLIKMSSPPSLQGRWHPTEITILTVQHGK